LLRTRCCSSSKFRSRTRRPSHRRRPPILRAAARRVQSLLTLASPDCLSLSLTLAARGLQAGGGGAGPLAGVDAEWRPACEGRWPQCSIRTEQPSRVAAKRTGQLRPAPSRRRRPQHATGGRAWPR
jgi:hypothetical protein